MPPGTGPYGGSARRTEVSEATDESVYFGMANPGVTTSEALWQIKKITTDGAIVWANGNDAFANIWDNRESLSYFRS